MKYSSNKCRNNARLAFAVMVFMAFVTSVVSRGDLLDQFRAEYPDATAKLNNAYSHVTIQTSEEQWDQNAKFIWSCECEYLRQDDLVRRTQKIIKSDYAPMPDGTVRALGGSSDKFFVVRKRQDQHHFIFTDFGAKSKDQFSFNAETECPPLFACCYGDATNISEYIKRSDVRLVSAKTTVLDGQQVVEIVSDQTMNDGDVWTQFYFLPETWAFAGWTLGVEPLKTPDVPHHITEIRVKYTDENPLKLQSIDRWITSTWDRQEKSSERTILVKSIRFGSVPTKEFSVASLGIAEPVMTSKRGLPWLLFVNGPLFLVLGVVFTILAYKRRQYSVAISSPGAQ